jgi:hypothetical protein
LRLRLLGRPDKLTLDSDKLLAKEATFVVTSGGAREAPEQFLAIGLPITMNVRNVYAVGKHVGLLRRDEIGCLTVKITSFPERP